jgi:hypothetical protein
MRMFKKILFRLHSLVRWIRKAQTHLRVIFSRHPNLTSRTSAPPLVVSLTSFPPRIRRTWFAIESIFQQSITPDLIVLTLAKEEFPNQRLPLTIRWQEKRGLSVIWLDKNGKSYDKLLPSRREYPAARIVTIDDDKILPPSFLKALDNASSEHPSAIIGYRGWEMRNVAGTLKYGVNWVRATPNTDSTQIFLPGNAGILYPPGALSNLLYETDIAMKICPTNDDFWFWGVAHQSDASFYCLGMPPHTPIFGQNRTPALSHVNKSRNDEQFQATINFFNLRRRLMDAL